jgi:hypothetical protein
LINTGAGVSLIHATTIEHLKEKGVPCLVHWHHGPKLVGISGDELTPLGVVHVPVTIGQHTKAIDFCVVLACLAAVLLGTGALQKFGVIIDFDQGALVMPDGKAVPFQVTPSKGPKLHGVFVDEDMVLDPQTINYVLCCVVEGPSRWTTNEINFTVEEWHMGQGLKGAPVATGMGHTKHDRGEAAFFSPDR